MSKVIRVLVVEDSPIIAAALASVLDREPGIEIIGIASDGKMAVDMVGTLGPDLAIMDVHMPVLGGLEAIEQIMARCPVPILVCTGDPLTAALSFEAVRRGALDLVQKPVAIHQSSPETRDLIRRVRLLAQIPVVLRASPLCRQRDSAPKAARSTALRRGIGIVSSTGGPAALAELLGHLPVGFPAPIVIVQHLASGFTPGFANWLNRQTSLDVRVADHGNALLPGQVLVAPEGKNLAISEAGRVMLLEATKGPNVAAIHVPSGNVLLRSLAKSYGRDAVGVVLSGMGDDGAAGLGEVALTGGQAFVQNDASSIVFGMPRAALDRTPLARALAPTDLARALCDL